LWLNLIVKQSFTKKTLAPLLTTAALAVFVFACTKSSNYSNTDHTVGLVNVSRHWSGYSKGYIKGDTLIPPATSSQVAALYYYHNIPDSFFAVQKVNGYLVSVMGTYMNYLTTDSVHTLVTFDTTATGSPTCFVKFNYSRDSMWLEYHQVGTYNSVTNHYYETNIYLHTN